MECVFILDAHISKQEPLTPPSSDNDSSRPESPASTSGASGADEESSTSSYLRGGGMVDSSRVFMCMFMFVVVLFNPFSSLMGSPNSELNAAMAKLPARTLQGVDEETSSSVFDWLLPSVSAHPIYSLELVH